MHSLGCWYVGLGTWRGTGSLLVMMTTIPVCFNSLLLPSFQMLLFCFDFFFSFMLTVGGLWLFISFPWWPHCFRQDDILHFFFYPKATSFHKQSSLIGKKSFRWESSQIYFAVFFCYLKTLTLTGYHLVTTAITQGIRALISLRQQSRYQGDLREGKEGLLNHLNHKDLLSRRNREVNKEIK